MSEYKTQDKIMKRADLFSQYGLLDLTAELIIQQYNLEKSNRLSKGRIWSFLQRLVDLTEDSLYFEELHSVRISLNHAELLMLQSENSQETLQEILREVISILRRDFIHFMHVNEASSGWYLFLYDKLRGHTGCARIPAHIFDDLERQAIQARTKEGLFQDLRYARRALSLKCVTREHTIDDLIKHVIIHLQNSLQTDNLVDCSLERLLELIEDEALIYSTE